ncbi:hypothetical protein ACFYKX_10380 [Cytobacillus sp. FJAT-54145]|uniref:Phage protein n=1 Tax=Cytobacillus spartinae TaxID=3299023 RepID=A0ABW6K9X9_9BACI
MSAIKIGRLHEITKESEELKAKLEALMKPLKEQLDALTEEEKSIREELAEDAKQHGESKKSKSGDCKSLSYPGLGTVSVTVKEDWELVDTTAAKELVETNPIFFAAQKVDVNKKEFIKIATEVFKETGELVPCVQKVSKETTRITLAKIEDE